VSTLAAIGLGANLGMPARMLARALERIAALPQTRVVRASRTYRTTPWGCTGQPEFANAAVLVDTRLDSGALLDRLHAIEREGGRVRDGVRNGARTLDLDLLCFGDEVRQDPVLTLPHPRMRERAFVLVPLAEIAPDLVIPGLGKVADLLAAVDRSGVQPWRTPVAVDA